MATKTIVRWKPSSPVYGRRELSVKDFEGLGIFTQRTNLVFESTKGNWLDAEEAGISKETREWLVNNPDSFGSFTVEEQEVPDEPNGVASEEATPSSTKTSPTGSPQPEGESATTSQSTAAKANTTTSTARG